MRSHERKAQCQEAGCGNQWITDKKYQTKDVIIPNQ